MPIEINETRGWTRTHAWAALAGAAVLMMTILVAPSCSRTLRERQVRNIQTAVAVDMKLIFDKQMAFREKHGFFTTDLKALLVAPKSVLYKFGFVTPGKLPDGLPSGLVVDPNIKDLDALRAAVPQFTIAYSPVTKLDQIEVTRLASYCADCTATPTTFKAVFAANLDDDPVLDVWTIDEKGQSTHVVDDLDSN